MVFNKYSDLCNTYWEINSNDITEPFKKFKLDEDNEDLRESLATNLACTIAQILLDTYGKNIKSISSVDSPEEDRAIAEEVLDSFSVEELVSEDVWLKLFLTSKLNISTLELVKNSHDQIFSILPKKEGLTIPEDIKTKVKYLT